NAFRGGEPDALGRLGSVLGVQRLATLTLHHNHRSGTALTAFTGRITERIGTAGVVGHRSVVAAGAELGDGSEDGAAIRSIQAASPAASGSPSRTNCANGTSCAASTGATWSSSPAAVHSFP